MRDSKNRRDYRPAVENLETVCLLSASPAALVHQATVVDLRPTPVGKDAFVAIQQASPHFGQTNFQLLLLTADGAAGTIQGYATATYGVKFLGSLKGTVQFKTSIAAPRPQDVKLTIANVNSFLSGSEKRKVQNAVVNFIKRDQAEIESLLPTTATPVTAS